MKMLPYHRKEGQNRLSSAQDFTLLCETTGPKAGKENGKSGEVILSIPCCFCFTYAIYSINDTGLISKQTLDIKMI